MRKTEFMDLLKYYFRHSDKADLKGILEDCEEQFRLGAKQGQSEEEICCKLGHPKNIYRYYIGKPIVPEDNPRMPDEGYGYPAYDQPSPNAANAPYDWDKDPDAMRRRAASEAYYRQPSPNSMPQGYGPYDSRSQSGRQAPYPPQRRQPETEPQTGKDFQWDAEETKVPNAAKAVASPFLNIIGTLFSVVSGILFFAFALAILACIGIRSLPAYFLTDLLPLPTISLSTMGFGVLAILFAALTASYASQACQQAARSTRNSATRRNN